MFRPLDKNVLLTKVREEKNISGLYLPQSDNNLYEVVNIGKEVVELKVGDKVYLDEAKLKKIVVNNKEYFIIEEKDIYLLVEE